MNIYDRAPPDVTAEIFDRRFLSKLPDVSVRSIDEVRMYGTYSTGVKEVDRALTNQWTTVMLTINEMVEKYKDGTMVRITQMGDVKIIYDIITQHLNRMKYFLSYGLNVGKIPIDDLILLDRFANDLYPYARPQFTRDTYNSILADKMSSVTKINPTKIFMDNPDSKFMPTGDGVIRVNHTKQEAPEERSTDMADFLKEKMALSGRFK